MSKKIAILRGINVGGKRKILMADLRALFEQLGFTDIQTYIQSGNVIFNSEEQGANTDLSDKIEKALSAKFGFNVPVIVRTSEELKKIISLNPFYSEGDTDLERLHLTFLKNIPDDKYRLEAENYDSGLDKFVLVDKDLFVFCNGKYHESKLTNNFFEKKLKETATTRNWKTVLKLFEMAIV